jgi:serine/threonine protein kinase
LGTVFRVPPVSTARISLPDRYRVVRHIANGGMASVWEAHDKLLDRAVAVKLLAPHLSEDDRARKRFEREARAAAGLSSHLNVVTIYDVAEHDGRAFMVMELMRGGTVADVLRRDEDVPHERSLRWLHEAASALDAAHAAGVVHRDVKPANLLLDDKDRLAIGDFGIARLAWEEQVTQTGQVLGTAAYISPEQAMGHPATAASDRYALSVVAFELLTGQKPFEAEHFAAQARAHVEDDPPRASELNPDLGREVDDVLDRGMAKEPDDRWRSAAQLVERLEGALAPPPPRDPTPPPTVPTRRMRDDTPPPRAPTPPPRRDHGGRRRGRGALLAGAAALLLIGVLAVVLLSGGDDPGNRPSSGGSSAQQRDETPTPTAEQTQQPEEETPAPTESPTPTEEPAAGEPPGDDPRQLQLQAFNLNNQGKPQEALPLAQKAVELCKGSDDVSPCAYALFEYAKALRLTGNPQEAVRVLEERKQRFPGDQAKAVNAELKRARKAAKGG